MNVFENCIGGVDIVSRDVFPNLIEISERLRVKA